jgi:tetratricopeptide (TPR) repeat protein
VNDSDPQERARALHESAREAYDSSDLATAIADWTEAIQILDEAGDSAKANELRGNLMLAHLRDGDLEAAAEVGGAAGLDAQQMQDGRMALARRHMLPDSDSRQQFVNGQECYDMGDWDGAVSWFEGVLADPTLEEDPTRTMRENLGRAYIHQGGEGYFERASEQFRAIGWTDAQIEALRGEYADRGGVGGTGQTLFEQGRKRYDSGDYAGAAELWGQAVDGEDVDDEQRRLIYWSMAQARCRQGEFGLALDAAAAGGYTEADVQTYWDEVHPSS